MQKRITYRWFQNNLYNTTQQQNPGGLSHGNPLSGAMFSLKVRTWFVSKSANSSPLKMDGWNTILSYWVSAYFQGCLLLVSGRVTSTLQVSSFWRLPSFSRIWASPGHRGALDQRFQGWSAFSRQGRYVRETQEVFLEGTYVPGSKLPLFPYNRGWSSTQVRRGL